MKFSIITALMILTAAVSANSQENSRIALDCRAIEINASEFEESFSIDEYPEVIVEAIDKSSPSLPAIIEEYTLTIGGNSAYKKGEDDVRSIRNKSEGQGHQKYTVMFKDGRSITIESQKYGKATLNSNDGSLKAVLECK